MYYLMNKITITDIIEWLRCNSYILLIILSIIAIGMFIFNQLLHEVYYVTLIKNPCSLCEQAKNTLVSNLTIYLNP